MTATHISDDLIAKLNAAEIDASGIQSMDDVIEKLKSVLAEKKKELPMSQQFCKLYYERTNKFDNITADVETVETIKTAIKDHLKTFVDDESIMNTAVRADIKLPFTEFTGVMNLFDSKEFKKEYGEWLMTVYLNPSDYYAGLKGTIEVKNINDDNDDTGMIQISNIMVCQGLNPTVTSVMLVPKGLDGHDQ
jgi:hypothetical protein